MNLHLSNNSPINTVLSNDAGEVLYTITTPWKFPRRTTTIYQHVHDADGADERKELARIHWHTVRSSRLVYNGQIYDMNTFLKRSKLGHTRTFQATDGKSYKWKLDTFTSRLELDDGSSLSEPKVVAKTQQRHLLTGKRPALCIDDSVLHILSLVIVTWCYVERRRREMQRNARGGGS